MSLPRPFSAKAFLLALLFSLSSVFSATTFGSQDYFLLFEGPDQSYDVSDSGTAMTPYFWALGGTYDSSHTDTSLHIRYEDSVGTNSMLSVDFDLANSGINGLKPVDVSYYNGTCISFQAEGSGRFTVTVGFAGKYGNINFAPMTNDTVLYLDFADFTPQYGPADILGQLDSVYAVGFIFDSGNPSKTANIYGYGFAKDQASCYDMFNYDPTQVPPPSSSSSLPSSSSTPSSSSNSTGFGNGSPFLVWDPSMGYSPNNILDSTEVSGPELIRSAGYYDESLESDYFTASFEVEYNEEDDWAGAGIFFLLATESEKLPVDVTVYNGICWSYEADKDGFFVVGQEWPNSLVKGYSATNAKRVQFVDFDHLGYEAQAMATISKDSILKTANQVHYRTPAALGHLSLTLYGMGFANNQQGCEDILGSNLDTTENWDANIAEFDSTYYSSSSNSSNSNSADTSTFGDTPNFLFWSVQEHLGDNPSPMVDYIPAYGPDVDLTGNLQVDVDSIDHFVDFEFEVFLDSSSGQAGGGIFFELVNDDSPIPPVTTVDFAPYQGVCLSYEADSAGWLGIGQYDPNTLVADYPSTNGKTNLFLDFNSFILKDPYSAAYTKEELLSANDLLQIRVPSKAGIYNFRLYGIGFSQDQAGCDDLFSGISSSSSSHSSSSDTNTSSSSDSSTPVNSSNDSPSSNAECISNYLAWDADGDCDGIINQEDDNNGNGILDMLEDDDNDGEKNYADSDWIYYSESMAVSQTPKYQAPSLHFTPTHVSIQFPKSLSQQNATVEINVLNLFGTTMQNLYTGAMQSQIQQAWHGQRFPAGIYLIQVKIKDPQQQTAIQHTQKFILK